MANAAESLGKANTSAKAPIDLFTIADAHAVCGPPPDTSETSETTETSEDSSEPDTRPETL